MFASNKQITALMDKNMDYVRDAKANGLGDDEYFAKMQSTCMAGLARLKSQSTNKKLIAKYEKAINELF